MGPILETEVAIILAIILVACTSGFAGAGGSESKSRQLLEVSNFRLVARIRGLKMQVSEVAGEIVSQEFYSNEQGRARIEIYDAYRDAASRVSQARTIFYYDSERLIKQAFQPTCSEKTSCSLSSSYDLSKELFYQVLRGKEHDGIDWLKRIGGIPNHVVGAARLLFIVDSKRTSLVRIQETNDSVRIRNHDVIRYNLCQRELKELSDQITNLRVSYPRTSDHETESDLPLRVVITLDSLDEIMIDYSFIDPLIDGDHFDEDADLSDGANPLDMFALPAGINCSAQVDTSGLLSYDPAMDVSFQSEIFSYDDGDDVRSLGKRFVAYDGYALLMRYDSLSSDPSYSTTIVDFGSRTKYNMLSSDDSDDDEKTRGCIFTRLGATEVYFPFLTRNGYKLLGSSTVRGVSCLAFEQITDTLPGNLIPHLSYQDQSGTWRLAFASMEPWATYNIVYHFAAHSTEKRIRVLSNGQPLGALMRVDVYQDTKLRYHMEVLDFAYDLVGAPNGDRRDELFSLRDRCTSGKQGNDGFASMSLKLEALERPETDRPTNKVSLETAARLLKSSLARNNAIMRAFARSTNGIMKSVYDLESQIRLNRAKDDKNKLEIFIEARLSLHDVGSTSVRQTGYAVNSRVKKDKLQTVEDCFYRAAHRSGGVALFSGCSNWCSFDSNPRAKYNEDGTVVVGYESEVFKEIQEKPTSPGSCPVLSLEPLEKLEDKQSEEFFRSFRNVYNSLKDARLAMPMPFDSEKPNDGGGVGWEKDPEMLHLRVRQVEINNDWWSVAQGYERAEADASKTKGGETIGGVGLTETSGNLQDDKGTEMNYERCHALCMSWMKCQSFSICLTSRGIECITSEASFRDEPLLERIDTKVAQVKAQKPLDNTRKAKKTIQVALMSSENNNATQPDETVELKVDFRCRLYKKNVLELFHKLESSRVQFRPEMTSLRFVGSFEKCAELCVRNNVVFFKKMENIERKLLEGVDKENLKDPDVLQKIRDEYQKNMQTWCASMKYLNLATSSQAELIKPLLDPKRVEKNQGLCVLAKPEIKPAKLPKPDATKLPVAPAREDLPLITMPTYGFRYSNLYKAEYGIQLRDTSGLEGVDRFKNVVALIPARDVERCASMCFLQTHGPEMGCRSFDFMGSSHQMTSYCALNSVTLAEIEQNNLTKTMTFDRTTPGALDENFIVWHYEPRSFTIENAMIAAKKLAASEQSLWMRHLAGYHAQGLAIFLIVLVALICSFFISLLLGPAAIDKFSSQLEQQRRDSVSNPSRSILETFADATESAKRNISGRLTAQNNDNHHIEIADITNKA